MNQDPEPPSDRDTVDSLRKELVRVTSRFDSLVDRAGFGCFRSSVASGRFTEVNETLVTLLGYESAESLLSLDLARDVYLDPQERGRLVGRHASTGLPNWIETRWKRRDGSAITVRLAVREEVDAAGQIQGFDTIVEDVTERKRQEDLRRRSERMAGLGTTLAGVAHELNNPLAAIMGFAQLLLKKPWTPDDRTALDTINREAIRSSTIVKDLLALARRDVERRSRTDVNDVVGYIARTRRYGLETAGVVSTLELDPGVPRIVGDRAQLEQVILNLIDNAEHALRGRAEHDGRSDPPRRGRGHIHIQTAHDAHDVIITVADDGPGIAADDRARIWDAFFTTKGESEGTGLGLSVVRDIVADHGGTITLDPDTASGARFVIRLPIAVEESELAAGQAARPLDVLVVEPDPADVLFVERFLTSRGHVVISAGNADIALRLATESTFDAVVCEARLVGRDGTPLALALRAAPGCARSRFILSVATDEERHPSVRGAFLVTRPFDVEDLRRLIEGD